MTSKFNTYLICVSFNNEEKGNCILQQFITSENARGSKLLFIENGSKKNYETYLKDYSNISNVEIYFSESSNKAKSINYLIREFIKEKEALIICIDDDIEFPGTFVSRYQEVAFAKGNNSFFGAGYSVPDSLTNLTLLKYKKLYQSSQFSKKDFGFQKSKELIFPGCNFAFFKTQWAYIRGFDERFGPGSNHKLAAQESVFQKKLKYVGYEAYLVTNNKVVHLPEPDSYNLESVKKRTKQNGFTHGFQFLINSTSVLKFDYFYKVGKMLKSLLEYKIKKRDIDFVHKYYYARGYLEAAIVYLRIKNKNSIYHQLKKFK
jgi:hypothetical protein